jgi:hypothetical protein
MRLEYGCSNPISSELLMKKIEFSSFLSFFGFGIVLLGLANFSHLKAGPMPQFGNTCTGVAVNISVDPTAPSWALTCVGGCTKPGDCVPQSGSAPGIGAYEYCPRCPTSAESVCCHAIVTSSGNRLKRGLCNPQEQACSKGPCVWRLADDDEDGTRFIAWCSG